MIRSIVGSLILILGMTLAILPATAGETGTPTTETASTVVAKYAWVRTGNAGAVTPWPVVPVAACTAECCCQVYAGGSMTHQCKSRDDCINAGGICRPKTDANCK